MTAATVPNIIVGAIRRAVAEIVTGARTSTENGLVSPPVKNNNNPSWIKSYNNNCKISFSDRRLFSGNRKVYGFNQKIMGDL